MKAEAVVGHHGVVLVQLFMPSLIGMGLSFIAGLLALRWLSHWIEQGCWYLFGFYCIAASAVIFWMQVQGA